MPVLTSQQRKSLEDACVRGRRASEEAVRAALSSLAITADRPPAHLSEDDRQLRRGLRAKSRQLGDTGDKLDLLIAECAYAQWHRLLFARFLAENNLLIHPEYRAPVTLEDCEELAESLGEPDGWSVAGRFAAEILPGIFRLDDPCVQLRLAPEGRLALEAIVAHLPAEIFRADDALGWAYQYWQREQKDAVNESGRKIGGADLGPVTQLFTDDYMVRFLLQNSLGAWWASHHPESPLLESWEYLQVAEWSPGAERFERWPTSVAEVTVMDPCCGSGHFLVEAFDMLWRARAEEEGLAAIAAQDAVLRENLFGLELDPRCVQIAMFALALAAWKAGSGWRELPVPQVACSGVPARAAADEWTGLARGDRVLEAALSRLHILFREADTLGSLIDPRRAVEIVDPEGIQGSFDDAAWEDITPLLEKALGREAADPASAVLGADAVGLARAADLLSRRYTLVATNVPYLGRTGQAPVLRDHLVGQWPDGAEDLAASFAMRSFGLLEDGGTLAEVLPEPLLFLTSLEGFRRFLLTRQLMNVAMLGPRAFAGIEGEVVRASLVIASNTKPTAESTLRICETPSATPVDKRAELSDPLSWLSKPLREMRDSAGSRIVAGGGVSTDLLSKYAVSVEGMSTGDGARYQRQFWELKALGSDWMLYQGAPDRTTLTGGLDSVVLWESGRGSLSRDPGARIQGQPAWGKPGVLIERMSSLRATMYAGSAFQKKTVAVIPHDSSLVAAIWAFCSSGEHKAEVSRIDRRIGLATSAIVDVPFDVDRWRSAAESDFPEGLADPQSGDPTQYIFLGRPETAMAPLLVGVARLVGYRWPGQADSDDLDDLVDDDGVLCLPSVRGERTAAERLQELLARAFGGTWTPTRTQELLAASGSKKKDLESWLREDFFKVHCQVFKNRPFIWQIWDGRKDGFSALVNYHQLDRTTLEKLTYSYLGDWIERQVAGVRDDVAGAEERLAAARSLQKKLELILEGEPPYDVYVRWKSLAEQPIGWEPDLNDGVRLNVRPFVEAGVLRSKFNVKWDKDRGKNPDGSERLNDRHYTHAEKRAARETTR